MFDQVWTAIHKAGHHSNHDWVIEVGADAVYSLHKLLRVLKEIAGVYLGNCKLEGRGYLGSRMRIGTRVWQRIRRASRLAKLRPRRR